MRVCDELTVTANSLFYCIFIIKVSQNLDLFYYMVYYTYSVLNITKEIIKDDEFSRYKTGL